MLGRLRGSSPWRTLNDLSTVAWLGSLGVGGLSARLLQQLGAQDPWSILLGISVFLLALALTLSRFKARAGVRSPGLPHPEKDPVPVDRQRTGSAPLVGAGWPVTVDGGGPGGRVATVRLTIRRPDGADGRLSKCVVRKSGETWSVTVWHNQLGPLLPGRDFPSWTVEFPTGFAGDLTQMDGGIPAGRYSFEFHAVYGPMQKTVRTVARGTFTFEASEHE